MKKNLTEKKLRPNIDLIRHLISGVLCLAAISLICARASAQNLFAVDGGKSTGGFNVSIDEFTPNGVQSIFTSGLISPYALAFDSGGNLFVADAGILVGSLPNGAVYKFTPAGVRTTFALGVSAPAGLAFDSEGNLFVAEFYTGNIYKYSPNGVRTTFASGLIQPQGLAFDRAGNLFVGVSGGVDKFTPAAVQTAFASGLLTPFALAFDSQGNLFVADGGVSDAGAYDYPPPVDPPDYGAGAAVYKFTPSGLQSIIASDIAPNGLAIDGADNLFVAESTRTVRRGKRRLVGSILKITPTGVRTTFASRLNTALAFQPAQTSTPPPTLSIPSISPDGGTFRRRVRVTLADTAPGASIYYTLDGSDPTTASTHYSGPLNLKHSTTVKAMAVESGLGESGIATATFRISRHRR
jgi:sugar lactone lactonase YvrE